MRQTEKQLSAIVAATQREKRPLKGADAIGVRVGKVLNKFKVGKFFDYEITQKSFSYSRKRSAIAEAEALDGVYILRTSVKEETLDAPSTVRAYKSLSQVEQAFRSYKTIDLKEWQLVLRLAQLWMLPHSHRTVHHEPLTMSRVSSAVGNHEQFLITTGFRLIVINHG